MWIKCNTESMMLGGGGGGLELEGEKSQGTSPLSETWGIATQFSY